MKQSTQQLARFGLLTALALVLGLVDRMIPLSAVLGGAVPGMKLGLANTVLLYAVYLMDWKSCVLLMLAKVTLSGFLFGSLQAILYSLAGGVLSLALMLAVQKKPESAALLGSALSAAALAYLLIRNPHPRGQRLWFALLCLGAALAGGVLFLAIRKGKIGGVCGTSLLGAVAHNVGQVLVAAVTLRVPSLLTTYLPVMVGVGAAVGCLTGIVTERVLKLLRISPGREKEDHEDGREDESCGEKPGAG